MGRRACRPRLPFRCLHCFFRYLAYKFLGAGWVNMLLTFYLTGVGLLALGGTIFSVSVSRDLQTDSTVSFRVICSSKRFPAVIACSRYRVHRWNIACSGEVSCFVCCSSICYFALSLCLFSLTTVWLFALLSISFRGLSVQPGYMMTVGLSSVPEVLSFGSESGSAAQRPQKRHAWNTKNTKKSNRRNSRRSSRDRKPS